MKKNIIDIFKIDYDIENQITLSKNIQITQLNYFSEIFIPIKIIILKLREKFSKFNIGYYTHLNFLDYIYKKEKLDEEYIFPKRPKPPQYNDPDDDIGGLEYRRKK